jgi:RNA polymerase sigma-70 factor (ECF subfamily)
MASDAEILSLVAAGEAAKAFEMLLDAYQNKVYRLAYSLLGERAQAEDAVQEIFLRVWKALAKYRGESALGSWIYAIARNQCLTLIAQRARRPQAPLNEAVHAAVAADQAPRFDVMRLVLKLPEDERRAVMLFYMEEHSYEEVARLLDLPLGTVKTRLHRARKQLASMIKEEDSHAVRGV